MNPELAAAQTLRYAEELRALYASEREQRRALADSYRTTVRALATALELRDDNTGGHADRVTGLALRLAEVVVPEIAQRPELEYGFLLHDLGKIGVPDAILLKPGALTPAERVVVEIHPTLGEKIVSAVPFLDGLACEVVAHHHERWDGSGYPLGLAGEAIPHAARVFAVVDAFDAITSSRPYREAASIDEAVEELRRCRGTQFDPRIVDAFVELAADLHRHV